MAEHRATVQWKRDGAVFSDNRYARAHSWSFDGGAVVPGSSAPTVVPAPYSDPSAVDPEEALVASASACHMLWFLHVAREAGFVVDSYSDEAVGRMTKNAARKLWISRIDLYPKTTWSGPAPDPQALAALHEKAHENCFIATSLKSEIVTHPQ
ncbi:MAG: OsmC family protein [Rhodospirillales bacterium]